MNTKEHYYIEDFVNDEVRAPKIIRDVDYGTIERFDFELKQFVEDFEMAKIFYGGIDVTPITKEAADVRLKNIQKGFIHKLI